MGEGPDRQVIRVLCRSLDAALDKGDLAGAAALLERLRDQDPLGVPTRCCELDLLLRSGRLPEARALAGQLVEQFPGSPRVQLLAGRVAFAERNYGAALEHFSESERLHPANWTRRLLGQTLTNLGRFAEAETILREVVRSSPAAWKDLAWLFERQGDPARALEACDRYAEHRPGDPAIEQQRLRLRARAADPKDVVEEMDALLELGQKVDSAIVPEYFEGLIRSAAGERARRFVAESAPEWDARTRTRVAWSAYKLQCYDVAFDLFAATFRAHAGDAKFLTALEAAARRCGRIDRLRELYSAHAADFPPLHGRLIRLDRSAKR